ncbi:MAG: dTMP kinase [Hyphomicrobiaceae bacterium]
MSKLPRKAPFITFEGGEGAGKTTQTRQLANRLAGLGIDCLLTREPGGSPFAEEIRALLLSGDLPARGAMADALLFLAARADHVAETIMPALAAARWVISDRFADSTFAYQGAAGGVPRATLAELHRLVLGNFRPDLTLILDLPPEIGLARAGARPQQGSGSDRFERREVAYHEALRQGFRAIAAHDPARCVLIDASGSPEEVAAQVWAVVEARLLSTVS